ncbi:MAG TPA: sensor histidine kinase [Anaerolineaceae bacterium]|nr:sensor histidine kinase [Anaerolineaceae bacterium]
MAQKSPVENSTIRTGSNADLAFAVVVLASYFAMFSSLQNAQIVDIFLMMLLGIAYIAIGIYGYNTCARSESLPVRLVYFAIQIPLGGLIVYLGKGAGFNALLLLPLAGHAVILLPRRISYGVNLLILLAYIFTVHLFVNSWESVWAGLPTFMAGQIFIMVFTQMTVSEEKARNQVERLVDQLAAANQRLREYSIQAEELAITQERNRLAREIHDGLGHYLTTIYMQIQAARAILPSNPQRAMEALGIAQNQTQEALADVRRSVAALRALPDENLPLPERIGRMVAVSKIDGFTPDIQVVGEERVLPAEVQLTFYRAAQEGLNNTRKHSQASQVWLVLDYSSPNCVHMTIRDDGIGAEETDGGFGLLGLQERVLVLNGQFQITSARGQGFCLEITIPG